MLSRIEAIKGNGATILFVSHAVGTVIELCDRAILLDEGEQLAMGHPKQIVGRYQKLLYASADRRAAIRQEIFEQGKAAEREPQDADSDAFSRAARLKTSVDNDLRESFDPALQPVSTIAFESRGVLIESPNTFTVGGDRVNNLLRGHTYRYAYRVRFVEAAEAVRFGMLIKTTAGVELGGALSAPATEEAIPFVAAGATYIVDFRFTCHLNPGVYFLNAGVLGLRDGAEVYLHRLLDVAMFRVLPESKNLSTAIVDFNCIPKFSLAGK